MNLSVPAGDGPIARRALVRGRVQGVWYRAATAERASGLGVKGHARNLADGSVEVLAVGKSEAVEALLAWLQEGPPMARVDEVSVEEVDPGAVTVSQGFVTG